MLESLKKFVRQLFSVMGLAALVIGGLTVFIGERCAQRCSSEMCQAEEPRP